ncbi:MAG: hypothetical protein JWO02_917 [Solirubrobacterales bacterium]|nr:hypothetical protein [Solirubrobacterales bacterium]
MPRLRAASAVLAVLATLTAAAPARAEDHMTIGGPVVSLVSQDEYFARYSVVTDVRTEFDHTRSQWALPYTCDNSTQGLTGYADSATKTKYFINQQTIILVPLGSLCSVTATWLVGGGGCSLCDGSATSSPTTFAVPPGQPRRRYDPAEKAAAARLRDSARRLSAKYYADCQTGGILCGFSAIYNGIAWYQDRIVNDPPDRRYRQRVRLSRPAPRRFTPAQAGSAAAALNALAAAGSDVLAAGRATDVAVDRAQGAADAKKPKDDKRQMVDARAFAKRLAGALDRFTSRSTAAAAALATAHPPAFAAALDAPGWTAARSQLLSTGVAPALSAELRRLGLPPDLVTQTRGAMASVATVADGDAGALLADPELLTAQRKAAQMLRGWAKKR